MTDEDFQVMLRELGEQVQNGMDEKRIDVKSVGWYDSVTEVFPSPSSGVFRWIRGIGWGSA